MAQLDELDVVVRRKDGAVIACIPQAGLYAKGQSLATAFDLLEQKKRDLKADLRAAGAMDEFEATATRGVRAASTASSSSPRDLGMFALKALIIIGVILAALEFVSSSAQTRAERVIQNARRSFEGSAMTGKQFWTRVETEISRQAEPGRELPEAERQKLLANIRVLVARWRPFVAEAAKLFAAADEPAKKP
jgi:hypothetical protein